MDKSFAHFTEITADKISKIEKLRVKLRWNGLLKGLGVALVICALAIAFYFLLGRITASIFLVVFAFLLLLIFAGINSKELTREYKKTLMKDMVSYLCEEEGTYHYNRGIPQSAFGDCARFEQVDRYSSWDLITGQMGNISFECAEIMGDKRIETGLSHSTAWNNVFRGALFIVNIEPRFKGHTIARRDNWFECRINGEKIETSSPDFNLQYETITDNPDEARKILTQNITDKMLNLDKRYARQITFSFYESQILIAIPNQQKSVEASVWSPITKSNIMRRQFNLLSTLLELMREINQVKL